LAGAGGVHTFEELHSIEKLAMYAGCNLAFLIIQFLLLKGYFFIRRTAMLSIIDRKIGWVSHCSGVRIEDRPLGRYHWRDCNLFFYCYSSVLPITCIIPW
jgi:hypothetical protein